MSETSISNLPVALQELSAYPNWVVWRSPDKRPLCVRGGNASSNDPSTWGSYTEAQTACHSDPNLSLGFELGNSPFAGVDLDTHKVTDPAIRLEHSQIIEWLASYAERSPNGGTHVLVRANLAPGHRCRWKSKEIEVYAEGRYLTVTGHQTHGTAIEDRQSHIETLLAQFPQPVDNNAVPAADVSPNESHLVVAGKVMQAYPQLWQCLPNELELKRSERDFQLIKEIARVSRNREQTFVVFMNSMRATAIRPHRSGQDRNKCVNRPQYVWDTIEQAFSTIDWAAEDLQRRRIGNQGFKVENNIPLLSQRRAVGRTGEEIEEKPIVWLFDNLIPRGQLTVLAGEGGSGKSTLSLWFAADLTKRGSKVLVYSSEDTAEEIIKPRLTAMGAVKANYKIVESTFNEMGDKQRFDPATDIPLLETMAKEMGGIDLLIVDSAVEVVPAKENPFMATVVRKALQPLLMLIQQLNCGCIGILHFAKDSANKKPVDRIMNSRAFSDVARMNLAAAMDEETQDCVFTRVKTNIAPPGGGFKYRIEQTQWKNHRDELIKTQYVRWIEEIESRNPRAILQSVTYDPKRKDDCEELPGAAHIEGAKTWLLNLLASERVPIKGLPSLTQKAGLKWSAVDIAKRILERTGKIKSGAIGYGGQHYLQLI